MRIDRFQMERTQCLYENEVRWNLSESGVLPLRVEELLEGEPGGASFSRTALKYPEANGSKLLRERIALFYPGRHSRQRPGHHRERPKRTTRPSGDCSRRAIARRSCSRRTSRAGDWPGRTPAERTPSGSSKAGPGRWPGAGRSTSTASKKAVTRRTRIDHGHQPEQPDRSRADRDRNGRDRGGGPDGRGLDRLRRGLSRGGGRGRRAVARRRSGAATGR